MKSDCSFSVSVFTSPQVLSKSFHLNERGELIKGTGGRLTAGRITTMACNTILDFTTLLAEMTPNNALAYGRCSYEKARVVSKDQLPRAPESDIPVIARTREHFSYAAGPGIMMLDVDAPKDGARPLTEHEVLQSLYDVCPELEEAPHVVAASASSFIYQDAREVIGRRGVRVFVLVADARDIPRAGGVLFKRLWLAGQGRIEVSRAGTLLVRGLIDTSVWQPERLDFAGGAYCEPPLEQRRPAPIVLGREGAPLITRTAVAELSPHDEGEYLKLVGEAKRQMQPAADRQRTAWVEVQVERRLQLRGKIRAEHTEEAKALEEVYAQAIDHQVLYGDFELVCDDGTTVTVGEVLDDPDKWHGRRFADPLEPGYGNDNRIARVNLRAAGRPHIYSHAHGGQRFKLVRARQEIRIVAGERVGTVAKALELMRLDGGVFERGGEIVMVGSKGEIFPLSLAGIQFLLDRLARWLKFSKTSQKWEPADVTKAVAEGVLVDRRSRDLPQLVSVITAPTMELPSGRIIFEDGLDRRTGLLLLPFDRQNAPGIPEHPSFVEVKEALDILWRPFAEFPFCTALDRGVFLAALFTALVRPALNTAPAYCITSPTAGSGKSLLARCLSILAGQASPSVMTGTDSDEEMRKRLLALGRAGAPVIVFDNLTGDVSSAGLCAWLTSETFGDRVLGVNDAINVPTRSLMLLTGNNLTLRGDLCRRVLTCRIDPAVEAPWQRGFAIDPAAYCREHRQEMVRAGLTVMKAALVSEVALLGSLGSFETWSDTVRRAVVYAAEQGLMRELTDPAKVIATAYDSDPETTKLKAFLEHASACFGDVPITVSKIISEGADELRPVLDDIAGERGKVNSRTLGRWAERNAERICGGLFLEPAGMRGGVKLWRVRRAQGVAEGG